MFYKLGECMQAAAATRVLFCKAAWKRKAQFERRVSVFHIMGQRHSTRGASDKKISSSELSKTNKYYFKIIVNNTGSYVFIP